MIEPMPYPTVFIHVPKTAGSTVNALAKEFYPDSVDHVEGRFHDFQRLLRVSRFISGHKSIDEIERLADLPIKLYSCVREPVSQLVSHISWQFEIFHKGADFFYNHPKNIQLLSLECQMVDFSCPQSIMAYLLRWEGLFLNCQSKYLLGSGNLNMSQDEIEHWLDRFEFVGISEQVYSLLREMGIPYRTARHNERSRSWFNEEIFHGQVLFDFLSRHHRIDFLLYQIVQKKYHHYK